MRGIAICQSWVGYKATPISLITWGPVSRLAPLLCDLQGDTQLQLSHTNYHACNHASPIRVNRTIEGYWHHPVKIRHASLGGAVAISKGLPFAGSKPQVANQLSASEDLRK